VGRAVFVIDFVHVMVPSINQAWQTQTGCNEDYERVILT
jgi:hypothetical protein